MVKDLKAETHSILYNSAIDEKLLAVALYNEIYNYIVPRLENHNYDYFYGITEFFLTTSECTKVLINKNPFWRHKNFSADEFTTIYLKLYYREFKPSAEISEIISDFKENMQPLSEIKKCVEIIDSYEIDFNNKVLLVSYFIEHIRNADIKFISYFKEDEIKNVRDALINQLFEILDNHMKTTAADDKNIIMDLWEKLKNITKRFLLAKFKQGEINIEQLSDELRAYLTNHDEPESKFYFIDLIYDIAGYGKMDDSNKDKRKEEYSKILNISEKELLALYLSSTSKIIKKEIELGEYVIESSVLRRKKAE